MPRLPCERLKSVGIRNEAQIRIIMQSLHGLAESCAFVLANRGTRIAFEGMHFIENLLHSIAIVEPGCNHSGGVPA